MGTENPARILVVDDDGLIRTTFTTFLKILGYQTAEAGDGQQGLELVRSFSPDLVVTDLQMPVMGGLEFLRNIRSCCADLPVIVVSGATEFSAVVEALKLGAWDYLTKPLYDLSMLRHGVEGALEKYRLRKENEAYKHHLEELVAQRTEELTAANRELQYTRTQIILRLAKAAEYRDNDTGNHIIRVSLYASEIAEALGQSPEFIQLVRLCSPMHDIGKIGIPDHILLKPAKLEPEEWSVMMTHATLGEGILEAIPEASLEAYRQHVLIGDDILEDHYSPVLGFAARIARSHHEKWDGTGYPDGLSGTNIPLEARIVAVADIYDALSSRRPYKPAFAEEECLSTLRKLQGNHLDPEAVEAFFSRHPKILDLKNRWKD